MDNHDYIRRILAKAQFTGNFQDAYPTAQIHALIDTVPAEDVQPVVHGKWKEEAYMREYDPRVTCTNCGETYGVGGWTVSRFRREMKFCPNCGARMDLETEQEDLR